MQQVLDDRCGVCFGWIGLDVRKSGPAEPAKDEMISASRDGTRDALAMMHAHRITGTKFGSRLKEGQGRTECVIGGSA